ncbi:unnamed protein product [Chilo suppressalis]|uniref:BZIP domain-containing protein n=1 Tax=Chilo suppressalis TaxID=168631 RepID=A0ABN8BBI4_CHISP|nr:unnamed protein product [Chilo suppressalis]
MALEGVKSEKSEENNGNVQDGKANGIDNKSKQSQPRREKQNNKILDKQTRRRDDSVRTENNKLRRLSTEYSKFFVTLKISWQHDVS